MRPSDEYKREAGPERWLEVIKVCARGGLFILHTRTRGLNQHPLPQLSTLSVCLWLLVAAAYPEPTSYSIRGEQGRGGVRI